MLNVTFRERKIAFIMLGMHNLKKITKFNIIVKLWP